MLGKRKGAPTAISERRQSPRLTVAVPMFVRGTDQQGKTFVDFATALNISAGGALLVLKRRLQPESKVSLEIPVGVLPPILLTKLVKRIQAQTVRIEPSDNCFTAGVQFVDSLPI